MKAPVVDLSFERAWQAEILAARPLILPPRHFTYPRAVEEAERGALEVLVRPGTQHGREKRIDGHSTAQSFLATCALGFRDPAVPTGIWSAPNPNEMCAVSGGYAYIIDTKSPERFTFVASRPVLEIRALPAQNLLLFVGHHHILAWGRAGQVWESAKLSDEGVAITGIEGSILHGRGWSMISDKEIPFGLNLGDGVCTSS